MQNKNRVIILRFPQVRMVFSDLPLAFLSLWALIHILYRILQPRFQFQSSHQRHHGIISRTSRISDDTNPLPIAHVNPAYHTSPPTEISLSYFYLCYKTNKFNSFFETLAKRTPRFWRVWFNVGVLVGILAMILGVGIMMIAGWKLLMGMMGSFGFDFRNHENLSSYPLQTGLAKRNLEEVHKVEPDNDHQVFIPVIPGVTLPISHLLYYLVALLLCGILHEAGHAIAAYCESVSLNNVGIFLYFLYPGAFVTFSDQDFDKCPSVKKLRILCAGVWHNVVIFLLGTLLLNSGVLTLSMNLIGYRSVEGTGVSVIGVEENTGLAGILYPSTLITRLDDYELNDASLEKWESYLLQDDKLIKDEHGFCASENDITPSLNCCDIDTVHPYGKSENKEISCFQRFDQNNSRNQELSCLYVKPILINVKEQRCKKGSDCDNPSPMCVIPYTLPGFPRPVRIYFKYPSWIENLDESQVQVLLWLGDLKDLWEIIQVSILQPRWSWIPLWIPFTIELIIRYTVSFSLALCILNIIPAFQLDGHHALTTMLVWLFEIDAMGDREGTSTAISISKRRRQRKKIENGIVYGVTGLVGWVVLGTLISGVIF